MHVRRFFTLLFLSALLMALLTGCNAFDRSYSSISTHVDQRVTEDDPSVLRAETYQELVSSILHFVTEGEESGTVRLYQYTGDVESDLESACQEVLTVEPMGAYALEQLEWEYSRIVSYYECTFTFTFRRSLEEINAVTTISSTVAFREQLQQTMDSFGTVLAVRTTLNLTEERIQELISDYYYATPSLALGYPNVTVSYYGSEQSNQRIIEVEFSYLYQQEKCLTLQTEMLAAAAQLLAQTKEAEGDAERLQILYQQLQDYSIYSGINASALRFLVYHTATPQGAAMAMLLLCEMLELEANYVAGTAPDGSDTAWIQVQLEGLWCHFLLQEEESALLCSDQTLLELGYLWQQEDYPECAGYSVQNVQAAQAEPADTEELQTTEVPFPGF